MRECHSRKASHSLRRDAFPLIGSLIQWRSLLTKLTHPQNEWSKECHMWFRECITCDAFVSHSLNEWSNAETRVTSHVTHSLNEQTRSTHVNDSERLLGPRTVTCDVTCDSFTECADSFNTCEWLRTSTRATNCHMWRYIWREWVYYGRTGARYCMCVCVCVCVCLRSPRTQGGTAQYLERDILKNQRYQIDYVQELHI